MVRCQQCRQQKQKQNAGVRRFIHERIITLRHGCLCSNEWQLLPVKEIATAMSMTEANVRHVLRRYAAVNCNLDRLDRTNLRGVRRKLSNNLILELTSSRVLQR